MLCPDTFFPLLFLLVFVRVTGTTFFSTRESEIPCSLWEAWHHRCSEHVWTAHYAEPTVSTLSAHGLARGAVRAHGAKNESVVSQEKAEHK